VKLEELRATTEPDRNRIEAQQLFEEAKALRSERTEKSYQQSIEKYETAFAIWHKLNEKLLEAYSLHEVGMIYGDIGLFQKAIDAHTNAADLYKELKLPKDEAAFLTWLESWATRNSVLPCTIERLKFIEQQATSIPF
jgi:tetratricopeptide (TPR) repeat protein